MTEKNKSQNEKLREHIAKKVEEKYDYTLTQNRKQDLEEYCTIQKADAKKVRYAHRLMLKEVLESYGINPISTGYGKRLRNQYWKKKNEEFQSQYQEPKKPTIQTEASGQNLILENPPITQEQEQDYQELKTQVEEIKKIYAFTDESMKQFWDGIWVILKLKWKLMDDLTEEENTQLARMWRPGFQKWIPESVVLIWIPSIITIGILGKKILTARDIRKRKQLEKLEEES